MKVITFLLTIILFSASVYAQDNFDLTAVEKQILVYKADIERVEAELGDGALDQEKILQYRQSLRDLRSSLQENVKLVTPIFNDAKADLADFGSASDGEGAEPEPDNIKAERAVLNDKVLLVEGILKQAEALVSKSKRLLEKVAVLRRGQFVQRLFETQASPFDVSLWTNARNAYQAQFSDFFVSYGLIPQSTKVSLSVSAFFCAILFLLGFFFSKQTFGRQLSDDAIGPFSAAAASFPLPLLGLSFGMLAIYQTFQTQGLVTDINTAFIQKNIVLSFIWLSVFLITSRLARAGTIRPTMRWLSVSAVTLYVVDAFLLEGGRLMSTPLELAIAQSYIVTTIFASIIGAFSLSILRKPKPDATYFLPRQMFFFLAGISTLIFAANVFGYAALSRFVFERVILLFGLLLVVLLVRAIFKPYFRKLDDVFQRGSSKEIQEQENLVQFWLSLSLDIALFFLALPLLARMIGAEWSDIQEWAKQAFFGFQIGSMTISISGIAIAIGVFLSLLFATRLVQRVLSQKILPKTKIDVAIRQSITQVLGYVGLIIALLAGISAIGFDLTNLALIAGALSVGIGFGLQSIVSNFVSGLILLFERPIKVGDWIITSSGEGIVKKVSVRATEIETFDRTSIIVPNAELISSSVKNWTHKDRIGRVIVTVGVSYDSDPHEVHKILLKCAEDNDHVLKTPAPSLNFKDFGDSALIFDVRFFIRNIADIYKVATQMRMDIWDALKAADIEISYPQRDLHIRTAPGLEGLIGKKK